MFTPSRHFPLLTVAAILLLSILQGLGNPVFNALVFDRFSLGSGELWRLLTGHLVHTDWAHLWWNLIAFLVLGSWLEYHSRKLLVVVSFAGMLVIDGLLLSPWSSIDYYCGLSGILNSLLIVGFYLYWQRYPTLITGLAFVLYLGKNFSEAIIGHSILTSPAWAAFVPAHFAGGVAGALVLLAAYRFQYWRRKRDFHTSLLIES